MRVDALGLYAYLGVEPACTKSELSKAYKSLCFHLHPDKTENMSTDDFQLLQQIWRVLGDEDFRRDYDETGRALDLVEHVGPAPNLTLIQAKVQQIRKKKRDAEASERQQKEMQKRREAEEEAKRRRHQEQEEQQRRAEEQQHRQHRNASCDADHTNEKPDTNPKASDPKSVNGGLGQGAVPSEIPPEIATEVPPKTPPEVPPEVPSGVPPEVPPDVPPESSVDNDARTAPSFSCRHDRHDDDDVVRERGSSVDSQDAETSTRASTAAAVVKLTFADLVLGCTKYLDQLAVRVPPNSRNGDTLICSDGKTRVRLRRSDPKNATWKRYGLNLITTVKVPFEKVLYGGDVLLQHLDGRNLRVVMPSRSMVRSCIRLNLPFVVLKEGVKSGSSDVGNLIVQCTYDLPSEPWFERWEATGCKQPPQEEIPASLTWTEVAAVPVQPFAAHTTKP